MDYGTRAKENFLNGYNCCQAVFLACTDELGLDTETRAKIASSFGGGMGGMRQVCGAVSGMLMALGLHQGYTDPKDKAGKAAQYEVIRAKCDTGSQTDHDPYAKTELLLFFHRLFSPQIHICGSFHILPHCDSNIPVNGCKGFFASR